MNNEILVENNPTGFKISGVYVCIVTEKDGTEGVPAAYLNGSWMPLIAADQKRLEQIYQIAEGIAQTKNVAIEVRRYSHYHVVKTINEKK